jgi:hypothetical protein
LVLNFLGKSTSDVGSSEWELSMVAMLVQIYLSGWILATIGVYVAGQRLDVPYSPAHHPFLVSLLAGVVWPLLIVGLIELSSIIVVTKVLAKLRSGAGIFA